MCAAALEAGKHVICDKPMALNGQQAEQMMEAARLHPDQVQSQSPDGSADTPLGAPSWHAVWPTLSHPCQDAVLAAALCVFRQQYFLITS